MHTLTGTASKARALWLAAALCIAALCMPATALAQTKPKRDTSKDKVELKQKRPEKKTTAHNVVTPEAKTTTQRTARTRRRSTSTQDTQPEVRQETYLRVNQLAGLTRTYSPNGAEETFEVNTNDKDWQVMALPVWCTKSRTGQQFTITCEPNPNYEPRSSWFYVRSDDMSKTVRIDITQGARPASGSINYCHLYHNLRTFVPDGTGWLVVTKQTLCVDVSGNINGPLNKKWHVSLGFRYPDNTWVKANQRYSLRRFYQSTHDGELIGVSYFYPEDDGSFSTTIEIPNEAFGIPYGSKHRLSCVLWLRCDGCETQTSGGMITPVIEARNKKGKVKTKTL